MISNNIDLRINIDESITERGIYFSSIELKHKDIKIAKDMVFARYSKERTIENFLKEYPPSYLGIKNNKAVQKSIIHVSIKPITYLSDVNIDTYNRWKILMENIKNNSII